MTGLSKTALAGLAFSAPVGASVFLFIKVKKSTLHLFILYITLITWDDLVRSCNIKTGYYDSETDSYPVCCYDLTPNTQYYYRAFVEYYTNDQPAYFYGEVLSLTTPEMPFVLNLFTNDPQYYWGNYYVIAHGEIECTMPEVVNQVGFCYSKDNEYPQFESDFHTTAATPTGDWHWYEFSSYIDNLSAHTKYYIRSYARYKTDSIKYGNVVSVDIN